MMRGFAPLLCMLIPVLAATDLSAQEGAISGRVDLGARFAFDDGLYAGQSPGGLRGTLGVTLEAVAPVGAGEVVFSFEGLLDEADGRSQANLARLFYRQSFDGWDLIAGVNTENWAVVESASVMNVINPSDNSDPVSGAGLLGTPMINANVYTRAGTFSAYVLTGFVAPPGVGPENRFRAPILPDSDNPVFEDPSGRNLDFALRYSNNFRLGPGSLDLAATWFDGTSRNPTCTTGVVAVSCLDAIVAALGSPPGAPGPGASSDEFFAWLGANATEAQIAAISAVPVPGLRDFYPEQRQIGLSAVYAYQDLQLKFEGAWRRSAGRSYFAGVAGGDYSWNDVFGTAHSMTLAIEYLHDGRDAAQGIPLFEDDVFLGLSYRLNNPLDTAIRFSVTHDLSSKANYVTAGLSSRISDRISLDLTATLIDTDGFNDPLAFVRRDGFIELTLSTFF